MKHKHRIVPGHMGGGYTPENTVEVEVVKCSQTTATHPMWHFANWLLWGRVEDWVAWRGLSGYMGEEEAIAAKCSMGGKASVEQMHAHPNTRKAMVQNREVMNSHPNTAKARVKNNKKRSKSVLCLESGRVYSSLQEAMKHTGVDSGSISRSCRKGCKAGAFHWRYNQKET